MLSGAEVRSRAGSAVRDPVRWSDLIQLVKTVVAAVGAWVLASRVLGLPQAFLAPWSALLVVHATVYRTYARGLQQVGATVVGVVLAWAVGNVLGTGSMAVAVLLLVGLVLGALPWLASESTTAAAAGLIVLTTGFSSRDVLLVERLLDTAIGIAVGLVVNLVVWPPLRDYSASRAVDALDDRIGELLRDMARELQDPRDASREDRAVRWVDRTRDIEGDVDRAWALLRQARESSRLNPRRAARPLRHSDQLERLLRDNEQAVAEARSMASTLAADAAPPEDWLPAFRDRWLALLLEAGEAILAPDSARVRQVRVGLQQLADDLATDEPGRHWPEYGALIMNLRNIVASMDRVAQQNPLVVERYQRRAQLLGRGRR